MANKLINYRINKLEELVKERGGAVERVYLLERDSAVMREQIKEINHRLDDLERSTRNK